MGQFMSIYKDKNIVLSTKHNKIEAISDPFLSILSAKVFEYNCDTDLLGTFSGEVERIGTPRDCVTRKCKLGMKALNINQGIASEGSFGPHPYIGLIPADIETIIFIDSELDIELFLTKISTDTNFGSKKCNNFDEVIEFVKNVKFPTHGVIVRPNSYKDKNLIFKGITKKDELEIAFYESKKFSEDSFVLVETDMRANFNPSRMNVIRQLANDLAQRLTNKCPKCLLPGFGIIKAEPGLECGYCRMPTYMVKHYINGCLKCSYNEIQPRKDFTYADPENCEYCNP